MVKEIAKDKPPERGISFLCFFLIPSGESTKPLFLKKSRIKK